MNLKNLRKPQTLSRLVLQEAQGARCPLVDAGARQRTVALRCPIYRVWIEHHIRLRSCNVVGFSFPEGVYSAGAARAVA
jgi:hypothetical protein